MNNPEPPSSAPAPAAQPGQISAMFAGMVMQLTNMATIFLGLAPHPQTGQTAPDLEHAKYFIDQLEMLEVKTRGNLDKMEDNLLKQSLTGLRMAFVEVVSNLAPAAEAKPAPPPGEPAKEAAPSAEQPPIASAETDDSRKKFTKKY
jgi:hypothetical protein